MVVRRFLIPILVFLIPLSALLMLSRWQNVRTESTKHAAPGTRDSTRRPLMKELRPLNWSQPVCVIPTGRHQRIPLPLTEGSDYLLILNNLETAPHRSQTVHLTAESVAGENAASDCYLHNITALPQAKGLRPQFSNVSTVQQDSQPMPEPAAEERSFYLFVTDGNLSDKKQYSKIKGRLLRQSQRVAVYLDEQQKPAELHPGLVEAIIKTLEHQVLNQITQRCGPISDIDRDGRFTILLSPWLSKLQGGKTSINGFVRPSDFRETVAEPFSNHCDMLYLNSSLKPGQELLDLLSHEVTHAAVSSLRAVSPNVAFALMDEEDWLNEGIAHIMEPGFTNRDYRISEFYRQPEAYPLVVPDYYRARLWRNHGCRGAVSQFLTWCNQIESAQSFSYRFTHHPLTGIAKIEQLTGYAFADLLRLWSLDLARQALPADASEKEPLPRHCGRFLLTGPAFHAWDLGETSHHSLKIASTASGFIRLQSGDSRQKQVTLLLKGSEAMQLTLLKIPARNRVALSAVPALVGNSGTTPDVLEFRLRCTHPVDSSVETIGLELGGGYLSRAARQPRLFLTDEFDATQTVKSRGWQVIMSQTETAPEESLTEFQVRIPCSTLREAEKINCLTVKAVVRTQSGAMVSVQTDARLPDPSIRRLAEIESSRKN